MVKERKNHYIFDAITMRQSSSVVTCVLQYSRLEILREQVCFPAVKRDVRFNKSVYISTCQKYNFVAQRKCLFLL